MKLELLNLTEMKTNLLFSKLVSYVRDGKYGNGWEFRFQLWASMYTIYVTKDGVDMTSFSRDTPEEVIEVTLDYLKRIKATKK